MWERTNHGRSRSRTPAAVEGPQNPLSVKLQEVLQQSHKTIYQLSADTGIDAAYIWRIVRGERAEVSREVVIKIGLAMVLEQKQYDQVLETLNPLLDSAGYRVLWGRENGHSP